MLSFGMVGTTMSGLHAEDKTTIKLGVMDGQEADVWKAAAEVAKKDGLNIELVLFNEYAIPNEALNAGDLDANAFQHTPYLESQIAQRGYKLSIAGDTALFPMGVYSRKIKSLDELKEGDSVGIPDDPSNEGRALLVLAQYGIITLKDPKNILATPIDIKDNPKKLKFVEMNAGMLGRVISDVDIAVVNTNWALVTGLDSEKDGIAKEKPENNPYTNIIVVRTEDKDKPWVKKLVSAYHSEPARAELKRIFGNNYATTW
ncbi:MetQ/NlpA family ABC transporter substrate-binding protein [Bartonella sp. HY329]|nr:MULTISPECIES: MetQ/NlpA family ABC transporter substrate-binding protein [unclassified Bartonella]UXM96414.1 MetQ/NlpA family ABC transporter substrate-binding protein [Bartonella sp. HY329]UXN10737.1 MetQ/NlpA family ABC transporter substrate-binding protein [Bartonella sp. HY328]